MTTTTENSFIIDVETKSKNNLIRRLRKLKTSIDVYDGGEYWMDRSYSQVRIKTSWTEKQLEDWLYNTKGIDYVGVCEFEWR